MITNWELSNEGGISTLLYELELAVVQTRKIETSLNIWKYKYCMDDHKKFNVCDTRWKEKQFKDLDRNQPHYIAPKSTESNNNLEGRSNDKRALRPTHYPLKSLHIYH